MKKVNKKRSSTSVKLRTRRIYSETFKRQRVAEIGKGLVTVLEVSKLYNVSAQAVYKWIYKYSLNHKKGITQVVQMESESHKTKELLKRISELESVIGRKQMEIDYLDKLVEISSKELKVDLKKNFDTGSWPTSTESEDQSTTR